MGLIPLLGRAALVFGLLALTLYAVRRTGSRTLLQRGDAPLQVLSSTRLGKGASLALVRIGDSAYALGVTEHSVSLLTRTDLPEPAAAAPAAGGGTAGVPAAQRPTFAAALQAQAALLVRRGPARASAAAPRGSGATQGSGATAPSALPEAVALPEPVALPDAVALPEPVALPEAPQATDTTDGDATATPTAPARAPRARRSPSTAAAASTTAPRTPRASRAKAPSSTTTSTTPEPEAATSLAGPGSPDADGSATGPGAATAAPARRDAPTEPALEPPCAPPLPTLDVRARGAAVGS